jgi:hypothetical protein
MSIKTAVGQVALVGGGLHDQPASILVDERTSPFARGKGRGNLYIVMEVSGPEVGRELVTRQMTQVIHHAYYRWRGSVTAGLREAIREANGLLFEENRNSLPGERRTAGVSCAVLRDGDLFVAQAGPAAVYLFHEGQVVRFPEESPWLDGTSPQEMDVTALGERHDVNVGLFHHQVSHSDTFLLVDSELACDVAPDFWPDILTKISVVVVLEELLTACRGRDLAALVVRLGEETGGQAVLHPEVRPEVGGPVPTRTRQQAVPRKEVPQTAVRQVAGSHEQAVSIGERLSATAGRFEVGERLRKTVPAIVAGLASLWAEFLSFMKRMVPERFEAEGDSGEGASTVVKVGKMPRRIRGGKKAVDARGDPVQRLLVGVAIAIPIIVALVVLVAWLQWGQSRRAELDALLVQANALWLQAQASNDEATVRTYLVEAEQLVGQFLEEQRDHPEAIDLQDRVQARLDAINQVKRISWVGELNSYPADANLTRVVVQGAHVFVMDRQNGKVYHHRLDEELQNALDPASRETVLVSRGNQVGDVLVGDLVDLVWMPTGPGHQRASLLILESGGGLLDYDPATGQLADLEIAANEAWQYPKLVGGHSGRFYVLDSSANRIWRYDPTPDGYASPPAEWLQEAVDLAGVVDWAIGDSIYLLYANGGIRKLSTGRPDSFDISDWDSPPRNPAAIFTRPPEEVQWLYLADRGNSRIVQASRDGRFKQQFRLADVQEDESGDVLAGATDLFVDEIVGHAYLLSGQKLYLLILPMSE